MKLVFCFPLLSFSLSCFRSLSFYLLSRFPCFSFSPFLLFPFPSSLFSLFFSPFFSVFLFIFFALSFSLCSPPFLLSFPFSLSFLHLAISLLPFFLLPLFLLSLYFSLVLSLSLPPSPSHSLFLSLPLTPSHSHFLNFSLPFSLLFFFAFSLPLFCLFPSLSLSPAL